MEKEVSWADIHPYMSDEELEEHIAELCKQYEDDPAFVPVDEFFFRPL